MISKETKILWIITRLAAFTGAFGLVFGSIVFVAFADFQQATENALNIKITEEQLTSILNGTLLQPMELLFVSILFYIVGIVGAIWINRRYRLTIGVYDIEIELLLDRVEKLKKRNLAVKQKAEKRIRAVDEMDKIIEARTKA
jgi:hypothetical protein